ncbi:hypothetical protein [Pedobacter endophyticus]|uniref:Uncharacterized protein n=1 Tax=Pedobacter endophyticus TaxID=2789740 RepID=A0A7U3Q3F7_9SPHI|nr:hypothetical protein [Pedobacter endophyticus]QPH37798.1 hypothetical protein IZT61_11810 [Pedobacter endophyticus]
MKSIFTCLFFISCLKLATAQSVTVGPGGKPLRVSAMKEATEGSPYFNDAYSESNIKTVGNKELLLKLVKYNLYEQQLEYTDEQGNVFAIQDSTSSFAISDANKILHSFTKHPSLGFVEVLLDGKTGLLKKYGVKKQTNEDFYTKKKTSKWIAQNHYYLLKVNETEEFQPSSKGIAKAVGDKKDKILTYIKNEGPDLGTDAGLIAVFKYYNGLN